MKIFDLTRGKYPQLYSPVTDYDDNLISVIKNSHSEFIRLFQTLQFDIKKLINEVPIFLVETSMANEYVAVPGAQCSICVPQDRYLSFDDDEFDIDEWVKSKEKELSDGKDDPRERISRNSKIYDLLGIYVSLSEGCLMPRRIFIWMDKIVDYAEKHTKYKSDVRNNSQALLDLVIYHEMGHAMMDVELYGIKPSPYFTYSNDYVYRFFEEAYANGIGLTALFEDRFITSTTKSFIEGFVKSQGHGYSHGWTLYERSIVKKNASLISRALSLRGYFISQWMSVKVLFNYGIALVLRDYMNNSSFDLNCVKTIGHDGWLAVKDNRQWCIIDIETYTRVIGFKKYDDIYAFNENGLCKVRLNGHVGFINEQGREQIEVKYDNIHPFENGIAVVEKDGVEFKMDINGNIVQ